MPVKIEGQTYYRTLEICQMTGISRSTLFRWLKEGVIKADPGRDWRGWRLFTDHEVAQIKSRTHPSTSS